MEARKWVYAVLVIFILAGFSTKILVQNSKEAQLSLMASGVKNIFLGMVGGSSWSSSGKKDVNEKPKPDPVVLSPNLSTCHQSLSQGGQPVYCCPPRPDSEEPFIDFEFPDPSSPLRIRRPAHTVDEEYIAKYTKAVSIMKSLSFNDPRSFLRQATIHCIFCTGAYNQIYSNFPMNVHRSWLFFPWHRMMIYFHERILGSLIGDDTFALPFWNWDNPIGMVIPDIYMNEILRDVERDRSHLPPTVTDINYGLVESGLGPEEQIESNLAFMYNQMVSGAKKTELFMGCPLKAGEEGFCDGKGTIESAPHNTLHSWVGSNLNPERENFGTFYSAARDPIFYAHHSNIDRLWGVWKELQGSDREKAEIFDPVWLDSYFFFHDENLRLVRIKIRDVLNTTKLGYVYEKVDHQWLNARPKPSVAPKIARQILKMKDFENDLKTQSVDKLKSVDFGVEGRSLDTTIRVKVYRPKPNRSNKEKEEEEEEEVLVVYGIDVKKDVYVKFDVYVNVVDEGINIGPKCREFAGTFVNIPRGVRLVMKEGDVMVKKKSNLKLGISELLEDLEADVDESIWVTLVPRGGTGVNTTVDGVRIDYIR